ncbi:hypothetical protein G3R49_12900 [Shewanella sp. WXL01]|uniref:BsuPI-related putative proteinase inhibitor n=1 Tax=Shewanella sp. WXL01 TaxID=2709721 RepID=UPI0014384D93|nr:BsuPI-related putative proteinase inhibitor [Shewanella sp. WXL01]NKF51456.1 hypothetical protein [Shewanella sp. WXL01]
MSASYVTNSSLLVVAALSATIISACSQSNQADADVAKQPAQVNEQASAVQTPDKQLKAKPTIKELKSSMADVTIGKQVAPHTQSVLHGHLVFDEQASQNGKGVFRLTITNPLEQSVKINFNSGKTADLVLFDARNRKVWAWSDDMMFTQALGSKTLAAGKSIKSQFMVPEKVMQTLVKGSRFQVEFAGKLQDSSKMVLHPVIIPVL